MLANAYGLRRLQEPGFQRLLIVTIAIVLVAFRLLQFAAFTGQIQWGYDFSYYWRAAAQLLAGQPIYSPEQLSGPYAPQGQSGFLYPPPLAGTLTPFAALGPADYRLAAWGWSSLGAVVLVATVLAVARSEGLGDRLRAAAGLGPWILVAAAFGFPPVIGELVLGNVNLLLLGLFGAAWLGVRRGTTGGERAAGLAIGIAAAIKVFPGLLLLWFLLTGRRQGALFVILGAAAAALVTLPITGLQPWLDYPAALLNLSAPSDTTDTLAPTVWLGQLVGFTPARLLVTAAGIALLAWSARARPARMSFTVAVLASILVAPALYQHYLAILVLPFLLLAADGASIRWLAAAYLLMSGGAQPVLGDLAWILNRGAPTLGALVLLGLAAVQRTSPAQSARPDIWVP